jgi:hypothetical protein
VNFPFLFSSILLDAPHVVDWCLHVSPFSPLESTQAVSHSHGMWMKVGGFFPSGW